MTDNDVLLQWSDINYWRRLCPYLTIDNIAVDSDGTSASINDDDGDDTSTREKLLQLLINDGYALIDKSICTDVNLQKNVCRGITDMKVEHSLPATFILLFDETWELAKESYHLLLQDDDRKKDTQQHQQSQKGILHRNSSTMAFNFDMLAWYIDPKLNQAGFSPHRDRQPESLSDLKQSFYSDEQAKYITHWIALADATPENSCLYVIPKACDPGYLQGDDMLEEEKDRSNSDDGSSNNNDQLDPLSRALNTKQSYQNIRALPRTAGQSVIFTHRILHWGSRGNPHALNNHPRVAISFVYSDIDFEAPYLSKELFSKDCKGNWNYPSFETRLLLVCAQLLIYYQRFNLSISTIRACYEYCKANSDQLDESYKKKVFIEYVKAMKEQRDGILDCDLDKKGDITGANCDREVANSDDEEALLEEMLNNSGEFQDDYDDMLDERSDNGESQPKRRKHDTK